MTSPSTWPRTIKFGAVLFAFALFFLYHAAMCAVSAQLLSLVR
jgi:hypothetical protein